MSKNKQPAHKPRQMPGEPARIASAPLHKPLDADDRTGVAGHATNPFTGPAARPTKRMPPANLPTGANPQPHPMGTPTGALITRPMPHVGPVVKRKGK